MRHASKRQESESFRLLILPSFLKTGSLPVTTLFVHLVSIFKILIIRDSPHSSIQFVNYDGYWISRQYIPLLPKVCSAKCAAFAETSMLAKVWLNQRGFNGTDRDFNSFIWDMIMSWLLVFNQKNGNRVLSNSFSSSTIQAYAGFLIHF
jgi:hypothetical protein